MDQNRHAIVMEKLPGVELSKAKLDPGQAVGVLDLILDEVQKAYHEGYVHADMSEYNVFVDEDGVTVFDWPQAVSVDHENAAEFLERDVRNLVGYFRRKHPSKMPEVDVETVAEAIRKDGFEGVRAHA